MFSAGSDVPALVLLERIYPAHSSGSQKSASLPSRHGLQEVIVVDVEVLGVAELVVGVVARVFRARGRLVAGRLMAIGCHPLSAQLRQSGLVQSSLLQSVLLQREALRVRVRRAHAESTATLCIRLIVRQKFRREQNHLIAL